MNVLSLFDGLSVGRIALDRAGVKVDNYFASEINQNVVGLVARKQPDVQQLGDVNNWSSWNLPKIDLLMGGSPCQDLSVCSGNGKGLNGAKSSLFWKYVEVLNAVQPDWFLLENVKMNKESRETITKELGVEPREIDSAAFSPQTRKRLYWTNIPLHLVQLNLKTFNTRLDPGEIYRLLKKDYNTVSPDARNKIAARYKANANLNIIGVTTFGDTKVKYITSHPALYNYWNDRLFYSKAPTLTTYSGSWSAKVGLVCPFEDGLGNYDFAKVNRYIFEYLQTIPIGYTEGLGRTEAFTALGNSWTTDVIAHILKGLK